MSLQFSIIIPVYNRPNEIDELLESLTYQTYSEDFEVIIVEDGSTITSEKCIKKYEQQINITYYFKENSGPGLSRNFGMQKALGNYFIILDSDCLLPKHYLTEVASTLSHNFTDAYGGPDASHPSFTTIQKAINYAMTSLLTTGGIRGKKNTRNKFQLRSFNMGISNKAFKTTKGFSNQRFGEDIDFTFRLWKHHLKTQLIVNAFVYHKRRVDFKNFFKQTFNFGAARPILSKQHKGTTKITYWFPSIFTIGFLVSILCLLLGFTFPILMVGSYFLLIFIDSVLKNKNILVALYSIIATCIQFFGYGIGFLRSFFRLYVLQKSKTEAFPKMFGE